MFELNEPTARRLVDIIDKGLCAGLGDDTLGHMCAGAAISRVFGLPRGDEANGVNPALRSFLRALSDAEWTSNKARAAGLLRLTMASCGSEGFMSPDELEATLKAMTIKTLIAHTIRATGEYGLNEWHKADADVAAKVCESDPTDESCLFAYRGLNKHTAASHALYTIMGLEYGAHNAEPGELTARAAISACRRVECYGDRFDAALSDYAETIVQKLIEMKAPGCAWLHLAPVPEPEVAAALSM